MAFYIPGVREFSLLCGCVDAGKDALNNAINVHGQNVTLLPGGIDEMQITDGLSKDTKIVMADRKGYAKLAIENGLTIIPSFCFGEKWIHRTYLMPRPIRAFLYKTFKVGGTLLKGRGPSFLGYLGVSLGYVYGEPIPVRKQNPVDPEYLDEIHAKVQASVKSIFDRHKEHFGYAADETLTFVTVKEARAVHRDAKSVKGD